MKKILIPVAAIMFIATATTASAFNPEMLSRISVDLTENQVAAFETASEMKESGAKRSEIKAYLTEEVGAEKLAEVRAEIQKLKKDTKAAIDAAVDAQDYTAFIAAITGTRLADVIDSEDEFATFSKAKELKKAGDHQSAKVLMKELGIERHEGKGQKGERGEKRAEKGGKWGNERGERSAW